MFSSHDVKCCVAEMENLWQSKLILPRLYNVYLKAKTRIEGGKKICYLLEIAVYCSPKLSGVCQTQSFSHCSGLTSHLAASHPAQKKDKQAEAV